MDHFYDTFTGTTVHVADPLLPLRAHEKVSVGLQESLNMSIFHSHFQLLSNKLSVAVWPSDKQL